MSIHRLAGFSFTVSMLALAMPAGAQTAPNSNGTTAPGVAPADQQDPTEAIVVTGSRVANRTAADSPVPVDVIGGDALNGSGYTETNKVLNQLVPSFNFPQPSLTDGTDTLRPATLRGLAPDQVLVLVNGKRRHISALLNLNGSVGRGSSSVDLNEIPPIAIDRIEVLRDGASSLYGSDAIAGVINVELSKHVGVRGSITYGKYDTSMKGVSDYSGVATTGGLPTVLAASGTINDLLQLNSTGQDVKRHDGDTLTMAANVGLPVGPGGYLNFTAQFRDRDPTNRTGPDPRRQYFAANDPRELSINRFTHRYGDGKAVDYNLFANGGVTLGDFDLYAFGSYGVRDADGAAFYRRSNDVRNRNFDASTTSFVPIYPDGYLPLIGTENEDGSAAVGIRGDIGGFKTDLSVVYGNNSIDFYVENSINVSYGPAASQRRFQAGGLRAGQIVSNLDLSRTIEFGGFKSLGIALGSEYRHETFNIVAGDQQSYAAGPYAVPYSAAAGANSFPGFRPSNVRNVGRNSYAGYVEADADVNDAFSLQFAGRYEHFSDFGSTVNGKAAARFEPIHGFALRGSISTGFRAPSLAQQNYSTTSTQNVAGVLIDILTVPVSDPIARALGSQPLKPEKATNIGGGVTFSMVRGLTLTADYYNIKIRDRVLLTENLQGAAVTTLLTGAGITGVSSARFFVNGADTRTQGVDLVGTYRVPDFGFGRFRLTAGYNYNESKIIRRAALPSLPGLILYGRAESLRITDGQPRTKANFSTDWDMGRFGASVHTTRYGRVLVAGSSTDLTLPAGGAVTGTTTPDYYLYPRWITDVEVKVKLIEGVELAVGSDNVFDKYPTRAPAGGVFGNNAFFLPYSSLSPFGFNGRFLYGRLAVNF